MGSFSDYLELKLLDHVLHNTSYTSPTTVYVALYTAAPSDSGGGTEVSGNAYARQSMAFGSAAGTTATSSNSGTVTFPAATPSGWGAITHFGIFDASSAGNLLIWGALGSSVTINAGDQFVFSASALTVTLD